MKTVTLNEALEMIKNERLYLGFVDNQYFVDLSDLTNSELKNILLSNVKVVAIWDSGNSQYDSGLSDELFRKLALIAAERL